MTTKSRFGRWIESVAADSCVDHDHARTTARGKPRRWWKLARIGSRFAKVDPVASDSFLAVELPGILTACGIEAESALGKSVEESWKYVARETARSKNPAAHELWSKKVLYVHRRAEKNERGLRAYRIGVTDDPLKRNAVKKSEDCDYSPFFEIAAPLCDVVEASLQTLLLPFVRKQHATNRRASCFDLSDELATLLCRFVEEFYETLLPTLVLSKIEGSPSEPLETSAVSSPSEGGLTGSLSISEKDDPRLGYFCGGICKDPKCSRVVPLFRSRQRCSLHSRLFKVARQIASLQRRTRLVRARMAKLRTLQKRLLRNEKRLAAKRA